MSEHHTVLSLDLGTSLGYAVCQDGVIVESGIKDFKKYDRPLVLLYQFLVTIYNKYRFNELFFEMVPIMGHGKFMEQARKYGKFLGVLELFAGMNYIPVSHMAPMTLKKEFGGTGKATKADMCAVCHDMGWQGGRVNTEMDNDEADAIGLIVAFYRRRGLEVTFPSV